MAVRVGSVLVGLTVLAAGCSADPPSVTRPPLPSVAASPSAADLPSPPPVPAAANPLTAAAASAFATFFVTNIDKAFQQAAPEFIAAYSAPGCGGCEALVDSVRELAEANQHRVGGDYLDIKAVSPAVATGDVVVSVFYRRTKAEIVGKDGRVVTTSPAVPQTQVQMRLVRRGASWSVQGYRLAPT